MIGGVQSALMGGSIKGDGVDIAAGLVHHWPLDVLNGTGGVDDAIGTHHLAAVGSITIDADGVIGPCVLGDAAYEYLTKNGLTDYYPFNNSQFSVALWVKPRATQSPSLYPHIISFGDYGDGGFVIHTGATPNYLSFNLGTLSGWGKTIAVTIGIDVWSHLIVTFDNGVLTSFLNGVAVGSPVTGAAWVNPRSGYNNLRLFWCIQSNHYYYGKLDDVRIYDKALSPSEVLALYNYRG